MAVDLYFYSASPPCRTVILTAAALDVPLNLKKVDVWAESKSQELLKMNPMHKVPTIDDQGFHVSESRAIMMYLCDAHGKNDSLYPKDIKKRTVVNQRMFFDLDILFGRMGELVFPVLFYGEKEVSAAKRAKLDESLVWLEGFLNDAEWTAGDSFTIADTTLWITVTCLEVFGIDFSKHEKICAWFKKCQKTIPGLNSEEYQEGTKAFKEYMEGRMKEMGVTFK